MKQLRAFIVEDSPIIRENLVATLEELTSIEVAGYAEDQTSAYAWLAQAGHSCDLVIVDIFLKSGSGLGLLRSLSANNPHYKRVVLTNYATPDMRRSCLALGADRVFDKSSEIDALVDYCAELSAPGNGG